VIDAKPSDRALLLDPRPADDVRALAGKLSQGVLVCIAADQDAVYDLRREVRDLENVMVTPADPEGTISWKDEFFTIVYAPHLKELSGEMLRVLGRGGVAYLAGGPITKR
jgi:hypothetical protein